MDLMVIGLYLICSFGIIYGMRRRSMVKCNVILSIIFYCGGVGEILFCDIDFPLAMVYSYVVLIMVNYVVHDKV